MHCVCKFACVRERCTQGIWGDGGGGGEKWSGMADSETLIVNCGARFHTSVARLLTASAMPSASAVRSNIYYERNHATRAIVEKSTSLGNTYPLDQF